MDSKTDAKAKNLPSGMKSGRIPPIKLTVILGGKQIVLHRAVTIRKYMGCSAPTLRRMEAQKILPKPLFSHPWYAGMRYYCSDEIVVYSRIYKQHRDNRQKSSADTRAMRIAFNDAFKKLQVKVIEKTIN